MKYFVGFVIALTMLGGYLFTNIASAQFNPLDQTCTSAVDSTDAQPICDASGDSGANPLTGDSSIIEDVVNILAFVAGVAAVVVIIISGISMMTSDGDSGKVASSRNTIIYTVVGLIIVVLARTIILFVVSKVAT